MISAEKIPNNVNLSSNKRLQRALEHWQPKYIQWWRDMGPQGFQDYHQVYVRTAVSVDPEGWAHFEFVKLPEYRWGIFLADPVHDRRIGFGDFFGQPVWQEVPGEFRNQLRRLIVTQGDTEPASVEQQRWLGQRCPSLYDLRNLFQVNVEEGRHLWAMVYLLHSYFGRDGRDEAEELLERQSGNRDKPRILEAFNEPIDNWLDFFMFTMFTDRDGKSQLMSLSESSLDPLSRTTRFMLTEEAHHMFVGETGVARILERTCQLMKQAGYSEDVRKLGGIDIPTIQKHLNQWFSLFRERPQGARQGRDLRRPHREERLLPHGVLRRGPARPQRRAAAQCDERGAARLVRRRLRGRRHALEQDPREARHVGSTAAAGSEVQPAHRDVCRLPLRSERHAGVERTIRAAQARVAAVARRHRVPAQHHGGAGLRAGQVRELHRAAAARHQSAANQFRVRQDGTVGIRLTGRRGPCRPAGVWHCR
jgi:hypothetical protein